MTTSKSPRVSMSRPPRSTVSRADHRARASEDPGAHDGTVNEEVAPVLACGDRKVDLRHPNPVLGVLLAARVRADFAQQPPRVVHVDCRRVGAAGPSVAIEVRV